MRIVWLQGSELAGVDSFYCVGLRDELQPLYPQNQIAGPGSDFLPMVNYI